MQKSIIIVGAGVAGLMAAQQLAAAGFVVTVLEANNRIGGRICTIQPAGFTRPVEAGAEFMHGNLPVTQALLKKAGVTPQPVKGRMMRVQGHEWTTQEDMVPGWDEMGSKMQQLQTDTTIGDFLQQYFPGHEHANLRAMAQAFAEGFDLADINKASVFSLREEWAQGDEEEQYRIPGGYHQLVNYLALQCSRYGAVIHTSCTVKKIQWQPNAVTVTAADGTVFEAQKIMITVPVGVMQAGERHATAIHVEPGIDAYRAAFHQIGFGSVTKVSLQFAQPFWQERSNDIGFLLSAETIPTWWTQLPDDYPLLTGWLGGPRAVQQQADDTVIMERALQSLAGIFKTDVYELQKMVTAWHVAQWHDHAYACGAYSYSTLQTAAARKLLTTPIEQTLFFAGEAMYDGPASATVEAALVSGQQTAQTIIEA
jgi:monoamine oxidase